MRETLCALLLVLVLVSCKKKNEEAFSDITVDRNEIHMLALANQEDSFKITTNRSWVITAEPQPDWLQLSVVKGKGDLTIKLKNLTHSTQERTVLLTVSDAADKAMNKSISITLRPFYNSTEMKMMGGTKDDFFTKAAPTSDGGFIIVGSTKSYDGDMGFRTGPEVDFTDGIVVKYSATGTIMWKKAYGGNNNDVFNTVVEAPGGGYFLAGHSLSNNGDFAGQHGGSDTWVMKIDNNGNKVWSKLFGGSSNETISSITATIDNEVIGVGESYSKNGDFPDITGNAISAGLWLKIAANGSLTAVKGIGTSSFSFINCITQPAGGSFFMSGRTGNGTLNEVWSFRTDHTGNVSGNYQVKVGSIQSHIHAPNNIVVLAGVTVFNRPEFEITEKFDSPDGLLVCLTEDGKKLWHQYYGGSKLDRFNAIVHIPTLGHLLAGATSSNDHQVRDFKGEVDAWAVLVNESGNLLWSKTIGGTKEDAITDVIVLKNKKKVLIGNSKSNDGDIKSQHGGYDGFLLLFE